MRRKGEGKTDEVGEVRGRADCRFKEGGGIRRVRSKNSGVGGKGRRGREKDRRGKVTRGREERREGTWRGQGGAEEERGDAAHHWQSGLEHVKVLVAVDLLQHSKQASVTAQPESHDTAAHRTDDDDEDDGF